MTEETKNPLLEKYRRMRKAAGLNDWSVPEELSMPCRHWIYYAKKFDWCYNDIDIVIKKLKDQGPSDSDKDIQFDVTGIWEAGIEETPFDRDGFSGEGDLEFFESLISEKYEINVDIAMLIHKDNQDKALAELYDFKKYLGKYLRDSEMVKAFKAFDTVDEEDLPF